MAIIEEYSNTGKFTLPCGSTMKIFDSDVPTEMFMDIGLIDYNVNSCTLNITVTLDDTSTLDFTIPQANQTPFFESSTVQFFSKQVRTIEISCTTGPGTHCYGMWTYQLFLRSTDTCPSFLTTTNTTSVNLANNTTYEFFESDQPTELITEVKLLGSSSSASDLNVIVDLDGGGQLIFNILDPQTSQAPPENCVIIYSPNVRAITLDSQPGGGCRTSITNTLVNRVCNPTP